MAKKVNTKFLFLLVAALTLVIGAVAGVIILVNMANYNPEKLITSAGSFLKRGDIPHAIEDYQRATVIYVRNRQNVQAADMLVKIGDLYSNSAENNVQYQRAFQMAIKAWQSAILQNPSLLEAHIRLMNVYNELAAGDSSYWSKAADEAAQVIHLDAGNTRAYRIQAAAKIATMAGMAGISDDGFKSAIKDIEQAIHIDPSDAQNYTLLGRIYLIWSRVDLAAGTISNKDAQNFQDKAINIMDQFVKKNPDDPKGWLGLAQTYSLIVEALSSADPEIQKMQSNGSEAIAKAVALAPGDVEVLDEQVKLLIQNKAAPEQVGKAIDQLIAAQPDNMANYLTAGEYYYADINRYADAARYLTDGLAHPTPGGGIVPFENDATRQRINQLLVDVYLNLADTVPTGSVQRGEYIDKANDALSWVRGRQPNLPWVSVNTGRLEAIRGQYDLALEQLKDAESLLSPTNAEEADLWVLDKRLQSQIYASRGQIGTAMSELDDIIYYFSDLSDVKLSKADLELNQNPSDALAITESVLTDHPGDQQALEIKAQALALLGRIDDLQKLLDSTGTPTLSLALLKTRLDLFNQNPSAAWQTIKPWVQQYPSDPRVVTPAYAALAGIKDRTDALQLIARAVQLSPGDTQYIMLNTQLKKSGDALPKIVFPSLTSDVIQVQMNGQNPEQLEYEAILQMPDSTNKYLQLTNYYLDHAQNDKALESLQNAIKTAPDDPNVVSTQFDVALALKDYNLASKAVDKAGQLNIDNVNGDLFQARLELAQGNITAALDLLRKDQQSQSNNADLQAYYGEALMASGDSSSAVSVLQNALKQNPSELVALRVLIEYYMAQGTTDSFQEAQNLINQGLSYSPLDPQLRSWADDMADLFGPTGPQIAKRQAQLKADPGDLHNVQRLALVYDRANEDAQAISVLKDAFTAHPDDIATAQMLVTLYLKQSNLVSAQSVYEQLSESNDPQNAFMGRVLLGDLYMRQGMNDQAAQVYLQAENVLPSQKAVVDSRMGDMYFGAGDYAAALKYYGPLHTSDPQNRTVTLRYAETLIRDNQVDAGLEILDSNVLNRNPNDEEALVIKGLAFLTQHPQNLPDALNDLNEALTLSPQDPHALYDRAQVYVALNPPEFQKAIDDLSLLESVEPNDKNAVPTKEMLAQVFAMNKQYAEAVHEYEQAMVLNPGDQNVRFYFAQLLFDLAQQYQQLSADDVSENAATLRLIDPITVLGNLIRDSLNLGPQNIQYAQWLVYQGQYDVLTGNTNEGIQATEKAYNAANKSPAAAMAYLRVLLAGQQYAKIVDVATQAIALSPGTSDFYVIRGKAFSELNRFPESNADFEQALTLNLGNAEQFFSVLTFYQQASKDPSWTSMVINNLKTLLGRHHDQSAMIYTALSIVEFLNNDVPSALSSASSALTFNPTGVTQINALRVAALAAYQLNKNDQAETYYKQLIQVMPGDSSAYNNLAYLLAVKLNNPQMALQYATQANDLLAKQEGVAGFAHNSNILDTLGWIYYMTGDMADAQDALQASMQYDPPPTAYYHLGQVLAVLKKDSDAREVLQNGLNAAEKTNDPVSSQIEALLKQLK